MENEPPALKEQGQNASEQSEEKQQTTKSSKRIGKKRTLAEKWRLTSLSNKVITIATVVIAGAGIFTFGAAFLQYLEMRDAGTQTDKIIAAERLAKAMEDSVKQGKDALDASIASSRTDQRAWIAAFTLNGYCRSHGTVLKPRPADETNADLLQEIGLFENDPPSATSPSSFSPPAAASKPARTPTTFPTRSSKPSTSPTTPNSAS